MEISIVHTTDGGHDLLTPQGDLDIASYTYLRTRISDLIDAGRANLVIDLSATDFLDLTALGALIAGRRKANAADGSFVIICDKPQLLRLFKITKLDLVFTVFGSQQEWRESIGG